MLIKRKPLGGGMSDADALSLKAEIETKGGTVTMGGSVPTVEELEAGIASIPGTELPSLAVVTTVGDTSWDIPEGTTNISVLVVAGGGGGQLGGGGAGGLIYVPNYEIPAAYIETGSVPIIIGAGGAAGLDGANTVFGLLTAIGGGAGGAVNSNGSLGGSGGGGGGSSSSNTVGGGFTAIQGYAGSGNDNNKASPYHSGGGGGAGGTGQAASASASGDGGIGVALTAIFGTTYGDEGWFAGGGGGSPYSAGTSGTGGTGGGGSRATTKDGVANTGGGGAGVLNGETGGSGGSGIVIIQAIN